MSVSFFHRHRFKFAAFFYFVGFIQIIYYTTGKLIPSISFLPLLLTSANAVFSLVWDLVFGIGSGLLFVAVGWLMTNTPSPRPMDREKAEPKPDESMK